MRPQKSALPDEFAGPGGSGGSLRIRDAVEAALADVILLGTEEQVRLAAEAALKMTQGRPIHTAELVVSLRNFVREVLDLDLVPHGLPIPAQGPRDLRARKQGTAVARRVAKVVVSAQAAVEVAGWAARNLAMARRITLTRATHTTRDMQFGTVAGSQVVAPIYLKGVDRLFAVA
ncbi:hypothetical protein [Caballeronia sp. LjRoot31]|uniref:hypothetical protein n=1 Tax=Caballeronia sp. LjRoot31 TaxID=3342324 RepID=UPI003ECC94AA